MYTIYNNETDTVLGTVTDEQLAFLASHLEEESLEDRDYYIMAPTVDLMESDGGDAALIALLRGAMGTRDSVEIRWQHTD